MMIVVYNNILFYIYNELKFMINLHKNPSHWSRTVYIYMINQLRIAFEKRPDNLDVFEEDLLEETVQTSSNSENDVWLLNLKCCYIFLLLNQLILICVMSACDTSIPNNNNYVIFKF